MYCINLYNKRGFAYVPTSTRRLSHLSILLTPDLVTQRWQKAACQAPVRNTGLLTSRVGIALVIIAGACVILRFTARWFVQDSHIGWDDWTILVSLILLIPSTILLHTSSLLSSGSEYITSSNFFSIVEQKGMGHDIWTVQFDDITTMLKVRVQQKHDLVGTSTDIGVQIFWIEQYIYQAIVVITKISIVFLYLRIFPREVSRNFTYICYAVVGTLVAYLVAMLVFFGMQCQPINFFWKQWDGEHSGHCINFQLGIYIGSGVNIALDLVVFFLPIPGLAKLQVKDKRRKIGVLFIFLVGLFVTVCSIIRLQYIAQIGQYSNATYHYNEVGLWSGVEADVGVICACMPSIAGPILHFFKKTVGSKLYSSNGKSGSHSRMSSRVTGDKAIVRLPSRGSDRGDVELVQRRPQNDTIKNGGIQKTTTTSMYNLSQEQSSVEDQELDFQFDGRERKNGWEV